MGRVFMWDTGSTVGEIGGHSKKILSCDFKQSRPFQILTGSEDLQVLPSPYASFTLRFFHLTLPSPYASFILRFLHPAFPPPYAPELAPLVVLAEAVAGAVQALRFYPQRVSSSFVLVWLN